MPSRFRAIHQWFVLARRVHLFDFEGTLLTCFIVTVFFILLLLLFLSVLFHFWTTCIGQFISAKQGAVVVGVAFFVLAILSVITY